MMTLYFCADDGTITRMEMLSDAERVLRAEIAAEIADTHELSLRRLFS